VIYPQSAMKPARPPATVVIAEQLDTHGFPSHTRARRRSGVAPSTWSFRIQPVAPLLRSRLTPTVGTSLRRPLAVPPISGRWPTTRLSRQCPAAAPFTRWRSARTTNTWQSGILTAQPISTVSRTWLPDAGCPGCVTEGPRHDPGHLARRRPRPNLGLSPGIVMA
jgi:hypothetical protein